MKNIIMLDIDGTLYDSNYAINCISLPKMIKKLSKNNIFVLNSNRAVEDMLYVKKDFNINGPIIAENGTIVRNGNMNIRPLLKQGTDQRC